MVQAYATGCYNMKEIALAFDVKYATVSRVINKKQGVTPTLPHRAESTLDLTGDTLDHIAKLVDFWTTALRGYRLLHLVRI